MVIRRTEAPLMNDIEESRAYVGETFPERLRTLRQTIGVSQDDFAKALGVSRASIGYYENGSRMPDIAFLATVSDVTGCNTEYLLGSRENMISGDPDFLEDNRIDDSQYDGLYKLLSTSSFRDLLCHPRAFALFCKIDDYCRSNYSDENCIITRDIVTYIASKGFGSIIADILERNHEIRWVGDRNLDEVYQEMDRLKADIQRQDKEREETVARIIEKGTRLAEQDEKRKLASLNNDKIEKFRLHLLELSTSSHNNLEIRARSSEQKQVTETRTEDNDDGKPPSSPGPDGI